MNCYCLVISTAVGKSLKLATSKLIAHNAGSLVLIVQLWFCSLLQDFCNLLYMYLCLMNSGKGPQLTYKTFILYTLHLPHDQVMIDCPSDVRISSWNSFPFHLLLLDIVLIPCQAPILILHLYRLLYLHNLVRYNITSLVGSYMHLCNMNVPLTWTILSSTAAKDIAESRKRCTK